jgi:hypothetical protein
MPPSVPFGSAKADDNRFRIARNPGNSPELLSHLAWNGGFASVPREVTFDAFIKAYGTLDYELSDSAVLEPGLEKTAIFGKLNLDGLLEPTHAALQLVSGEWTSKLGKLDWMRLRGGCMERQCFIWLAAALTSSRP